MKPQDWESPQSSDTKILILSAFIAILIEAIVIIAIGLEKQDLLSRPTDSSIEDSRFVEAQMVQMPEEAHLVEEKKETTPVAKPDPVLSRVAGKGKKAESQSSDQEEQNETQSGPPPVARTHGPIVVYSPPPIIPTYLQNQDLKTHVVIDFYVKVNGDSTPRLVGPSGNEELDAIALSTVKKWQFRPAEEDGKPVDSKVRLRIVFEVK